MLARWIVAILVVAFAATPMSTMASSSSLAVASATEYEQVQLLFPGPGMDAKANSSALADGIASALGLGEVARVGDDIYAPFSEPRSYYSLLYGPLTVRAPPLLSEMDGIPYGEHVMVQYTGNRTDVLLVYGDDHPDTPLMACLVDTGELNATGADNSSRESVARSVAESIGVPAGALTSVVHLEDDHFYTVILSGEVRGQPMSWCNLAVVKFSKEDYSVRLIQVLPFVSADEAYFSVTSDRASELCEEAINEELNGDTYVGSELTSIRLVMVREVVWEGVTDEGNTSYSEVFKLRLGYEFKVTIDDNMYETDYFDLVVIDCNDGSNLLIVKGPVPIGTTSPFVIFLPWILTLGLAMVLIVLVVHFETSPEFAALVLQSILLPVYMRIRGAQALDSFNRGRIFEHIRMYPGSSFSGLKGSLDMGNGTLAYHLSVLQKLELIRSEKDGRERRYFLCGVTYPIRPDTWLGKTEAKVLEELVANGPMSTSKVAERLQISRQRAHYNMRLLLRRGLAVHERPLWRAVQDRAGGHTQES